mmetsp:Transcript_18646/g.55859  ORF Transcript_18646/g.55859 Transcript_18646/m.55859 type:complete len:293 (+) Transcript_18646:1660-2538(+)
MAKPSLLVRWLGSVEYEPTFELQRKLARRLRESMHPHTGRSTGKSHNTLLLLEHSPAVYTMGTRNCAEDLLVDQARLLDEYGTRVVKTNRGGALTWHGPGQLVGYLVANCRDLFPHRDPSVRELVHRIEEVMIRSLSSAYQLRAHRLSRKEVGVWIGQSSEEQEASVGSPSYDAPVCSLEMRSQTSSLNKVGAVGLHLSEWISTHGFALNVDPDLSAFDRIVSCGIRDKGVTSVARELLSASEGSPILAARPTVRELVPHVVKHFERVFDVELTYDEGTPNESQLVSQSVRE